MNARTIIPHGPPFTTPHRPGLARHGLGEPVAKRPPIILTSKDSSPFCMLSFSTEQG